MQPSALLTNFRRNATKALVVATLAAQPVLAQDAMKNSILQNKADQQDVRQHTTTLAIQIQSLIDELGENSIAGDDIKVLETTKAVLNNMSAQEMSRVIESLQKAGDSAGTTDGEKSLVDAYGDQKGIIQQFRQILKDYSQRQAADELPAKFKELSERQTQVMWTTAQVATDIRGKSQSELNTMQQTTSQIVQTDQNALVNDVATAKQMLDKAAQGSSGEQGRAMQQAEQDLKDGKLQDALDKANTALNAGHLLEATTQQKIARDQLRQVAKDLNPPTTTVDAMSGFAATLNKLIEQLKDLQNQTNAAAGVKPRVTGLDIKQALFVDQANSLQEDMQSMSPIPAGLVKDAINPMQLARADLGPAGGDFAKAAASQQDAIDKLEEAAKQMTQQLADAKKAADDVAKDATDKLKDLHKQIQQAMQQQQQTAQQTAKANSATPPDPSALAQAQKQQDQLKQQAEALEQTASPLSLPAAEALSKASTAMNHAQQAMSDPANTQDAQAAQQAAQQALQQADQAVGQQIAQNQQKANDPSQLAHAANALQQAQSDVSNAMANTPSPQSGSPQAGSPQAGSPQAGSPPSASPGMAQAQADLAQAAQATQAAAAVPGLPDAAASAVQDAEKSLAQGEQAASQGNAPATAADAAAAQASLAQAQAAVAVAQAGMTPGPAMAGGPPTPGGQPMPGMPGIPGMNPAPPGPDMPSADGAKTISGGSTDKGTLHDTTGNGKFITVMSRERTAITETQREDRPQEYAPMIDQYMKNLSDQDTSASQ